MIMAVESLLPTHEQNFVERTKLELQELFSDRPTEAQTQVVCWKCSKPLIQLVSQSAVIVQSLWLRHVIAVGIRIKANPGERFAVIFSHSTTTCTESEPSTMEFNQA